MHFDFDNLLTILASVAGAGGIGGFVGWRLRKRKEVAEVKGDEIDNLKATIESVYGPIVQQLKERVDDLEAEVNDLRRENNRLIRENNKLKNEIYELRTGRPMNLKSLSAQRKKRNPDGTFVKEER